MAFAALAAALLATLSPFFVSQPDPGTIILAERPPSVAPVVAESPAVTDQDLNWPEVLATLEEFPRRLEELGSVYYYTAQMTGVSSLTSPWSLTVDLLRNRLNREPPFKRDGAGTNGQHQKSEHLNPLA
jgi:hypothetical protein